MSLQILNIDSDEPIITLYGPIGIMNDGLGGFTGESGENFAAALNYLNVLKKKRISVYINSEGGSVTDGMTMYSAIKSSSVPVDTICTGIAVSMAGVILQAGKTRQMVSWGQMMIHPPAGGDSKSLDALKETLIKMLCSSSGIDEKEMENIMDSTSWINAETCLEMKLIDKIADIEIDETPVISPSTDVATAYAKFSKITNSLFKKEPIIYNPKMSKVTNYLELSDAANEVDIINSLKEKDKTLHLYKKGVYNALKNSKKKDEADPDEEEDPEDAIKALMNQIAALKKDCEELQNALNAKSEECDALNKAKKEAEDAINAKEAEDAVNTAINSGKIKADAKAAWIGMFMADKAHTQGLIDSIPIVKVNGSFKVTPATREQIEHKVEVVNGIRQIKNTGDDEDPILKFNRERIKKAKEVQNNYKK